MKLADVTKYNGIICQIFGLCKDGSNRVTRKTIKCVVLAYRLDTIGMGERANGRPVGAGGWHVYQGAKWLSAAD